MRTNTKGRELATGTGCRADSRRGHQGALPGLYAVVQSSRPEAGGWPSYFTGKLSHLEGEELAQDRL